MQTLFENNEKNAEKTILLLYTDHLYSFSMNGGWCVEDGMF